MKFTIAVSAAALIAGAQAAYSNVTDSPVVYTTVVVAEYTTYCPFATEVTQNGQTYTVSEATTLTITDCPCTVTSALTSAVAVAAVTGATTTPSASWTASVTGNATGTWVASNSTSTAEAFTGAANKAAVGGIAAIFGLAAFAL